LEERISLAGDLLLTTEVPGVNLYNLMQYTQDGALVRSLPIPPPPSGDTPARGLSVGPFGDAHVFDGSSLPALATLPADSPTWSFQTYPGWYAGGADAVGEVAADHRFVFASSGTGIVRFDAAGGPAVWFGDAPPYSYVQLSLGLDGKLYGFGGTTPHTLRVFDPDSLALLRTFTLQGGPDSDIRAVAVDASGQLLAATWGWYVVKYDATGRYLSSIQLQVPQSLFTIVIDNDGQVALGGRFGAIYLTDESLASVRTIQTNQWNAYVTFDHYIGTSLQVGATGFDSLAGPAIRFGQPSVTLGGRVTADAAPSGGVSITLAGVTHVAAINPADGTFASDFDTSTLGASGSPYTIQYRYYGDATHAAVADASQALTVTPALTLLVDLSSPVVAAGTPSVTLSGLVVSNFAVPVGQAITVTAVGVDGTAVTASGVIGSDGRFSVTLDTSALAVGSYTLQYVYPGDDNFNPSDDTGALTVTA
jgi:hypothetical protein